MRPAELRKLGIRKVGATQPWRCRSCGAWKGAPEGNDNVGDGTCVNCGRTYYGEPTRAPSEADQPFRPELREEEG